MRRLLLARSLVLVVCLSAASRFVSVAAGQGDPNRGVRFEQHLNGQISTDATFLDETGQQVRLSQFLSRPTILTMGYFRCPMLCGVVLDSITKVFTELRDLTPGKDYQFIFVGVDPSEVPAFAAAKKQTYLNRFGNPAAAAGWHFLLGSQTQVDRVADEIGFRFRYDMASQQFVHPSGLVFVTPNGRISSYLMGVNYSGNELRRGLTRASHQKIGSPVDDLLLLCLHYNPKIGFGPLIFGSLRVLALITLAAVSWLVWRGVRHRHPSA
jgi:protein SCO1